jgi:hypothetical protein
MTWKILRLSAKIKHLQWSIQVHRPLMNPLKRKCLGQSLAAHQRLLETVRIEYQKGESEIVCRLSNCETR